MRAGLTPIVTVFGLDLAALLGGAIITETIFNLPGIGQLTVQSVGTQDLSAIAVITLVAATFVVVANLIVDIVYAILDPRVRRASRWRLMPEPLLEVKDLKVHFPTQDGLVKAVDGLTFTVQPGETLGVVGESGSGKSVSFLTVMGLISRKSAVIEGQVFFQGQDLLQMTNDELREVRGAKIAMIFQDPMTSLHPFYKVGDQIAEMILAHEDGPKKDAARRAVEMLGEVNIPQPEERAKQYPHEFSGGMRQRAMIAMALSLNPDLLIADEPTTALDVTVQAQILELIDRLQSEFNTAVALITHDLGVVAE